MGQSTAWCKVPLFCAKNTVNKSRNFELARLKKKKNKETHFGYLVIFWFSIFTMLFTPLSMLIIMKTLEGEWYIVIKAYKFTILRF